MIIGPLANGGASLESAPLAREIAAAAYRAGSPLVETIYGDEAQQSLRFKHAPRDSFGNFSAWLPDGALRARGGRPCRAVDQRERPGSSAGRAARSGERRAAGDRARDAAVPRAGLAQRHQLGDRRGSERRRGRKRSFPACRRARRSRDCGTPSRACAVSTRRIRSRPGKHTSAISRRAAST